jgi:hypothetical protein
LPESWPLTFFYYCIPFYVGTASKSGSITGLHSGSGSAKVKVSVPVVPVPQHWGEGVFMLQITRFQIVCGEEEFKRCRLQSFRLLRERRMSLSDHTGFQAQGEKSLGDTVHRFSGGDWGGRVIV